MSHLKGMPSMPEGEEIEDWCRAHAVTFGGGAGFGDVTLSQLAERQRAYRLKWGGRTPEIASTHREDAARRHRSALSSLTFAQKLTNGETIMNMSKPDDSQWTAEDAAYARATGRTKEQMLAARKLWQETGGIVSHDHVKALNAKQSGRPI